MTPKPKEPKRATPTTPSAKKKTRTVGAAASYKLSPTPKETAKEIKQSQKDALVLLIAQKRANMTNAEQQDYSVTSKTETFRLQPRYFQDQLDDDMERSPEFTLISR